MDHYVARGNEVFYVDVDGREDLFLTVHPTRTNLPLEKVTQVLAEVLNRLAAFKSTVDRISCP